MRENILYHGTGITNAVQILQDNKIIATSWHDEVVNNKKTVSLTRSLQFAKKYSKDSIVFAFDEIKLRQNYKIIPVYYFKGSPYNGTYYKKRKESEEACIGDIFPLKKYLSAIYITSTLKSYISFLRTHGDEKYSIILDNPLLKIIQSHETLSKDEKHILAKNGNWFDTSKDDENIFDKTDTIFA